MDSQIVRAKRPFWLAGLLAALATGPAGLASIIVTAAFRDDSDAGIGWWAVPAIALLVLLPCVPLAAYAIRRRRNLRLELTDAGLSHVDSWGRRTAVARGQIVAVYTMPVRRYLEGGLVTVVAGKDQRALISLWRKDWDDHQLDRLWSELGLRSEFYPVRPYLLAGAPVAVARTEFPGIWLPPSFAHPVRTALLAVTAVVLWAAAWTWLMVALTSA